MHKVKILIYTTILSKKVTFSAFMYRIINGTCVYVLVREVSHKITHGNV